MFSYKASWVTCILKYQNENSSKGIQIYICKLSVTQCILLMTQGYSTGAHELGSLFPLKSFSNQISKNINIGDNNSNININTQYCIFAQYTENR